MISADRKWRLLVVSAVLVMMLGSACHASLLGLSSMFPNTQGENGWYARGFNPDTMVWRNLDCISPKVFKTSITPPSYVPMVLLSYKGLIMHPGICSTYGTEWAVLTYVAPTAGDYSFSIEFANAAAGAGCTTRALVFVNNTINTPVAQGQVSLTQTPYFAYTVNLNAGDCLNFAVDPMGSHSADSTVVRDVAPVAVPEPATMFALAAGLIGLVVRRRK